MDVITRLRFSQLIIKPKQKAATHQGIPNLALHFRENSPQK